MVDREEILRSFAVLSPKKQLALALLVLERLLPCLAPFSQNTGFDGASCIKAQEAAWMSLHSASKRDALYRSLNEACLKNVPDTEEYSDDLTSDALNTVIAVSEIMEYLLDGSPEHIAYVLTLARESVYLYLSNLANNLITSPDEAERIFAHPLMLRELRLEEEDIRFLAGLPDQFDEQVSSSIRSRASSQLPLLPFAGSGQF